MDRQTHRTSQATVETVIPSSLSLSSLPLLGRTAGTAGVLRGGRTQLQGLSVSPASSEWGWFLSCALGDPACGHCEQLVAVPPRGLGHVTAETGWRLGGGGSFSIAVGEGCVPSQDYS